MCGFTVGVWMDVSMVVWWLGGYLDELVRRLVVVDWMYEWIYG